MKIAYFGTPRCAADVLTHLLKNRLQVAVCVTQPDQPKGRGRKLLPPPVKEVALQHGIRVLQPESVKNNAAFLDEFRALGVDLAVVVSYGQILPQTLLDVPPKGFINLHFSLLPRHRGASPVQTAILNGDSVTGASIMKVVKKLDAGPVYTQRKVPINANDTAATLEAKLAREGGALLLEALEAFSKHLPHAHMQDDTKATYAHQLKKIDGLLDWSRSASELDRRIRAMNPWPGAYSMLHRSGREALRLMVWQAAVEPATPGAPGGIAQADKRGWLVCCGNGALRLEVVQAPGKDKMDAQAFLRGAGVSPSDFFANE